MKYQLAPLMLAAATTMLAGCGTQNAVFVTKTSLSVIDIDSTPPSASIAYDRIEGYVGPRFDDGAVYPVAGSLRTTGEGLTRDVQQVFAGGDAGLLVQKATPPKRDADPKCSDDRTNPPLVFATGTTVGIKVGFAQGTPIPDSFVFGFRRKEAASVPVSKECRPSVLATFSSNVNARQETGQPKLNAGITQYFATGGAADALAKKKHVQDLFEAEALDAMRGVVGFNQREALQTRMALDVLTCVGKVPDAKFDRVVNNAEDLALIDPGAAAHIFAAPTPAEQRRRYGELLSLRLGESAEYGAALRFHERRVCEIAKAGQ